MPHPPGAGGGGRTLHDPAHRTPGSWRRALAGGEGGGQAAAKWTHSSASMPASAMAGPACDAAAKAVAAMKNPAAAAVGADVAGRVRVSAAAHAGRCQCGALALTGSAGAGRARHRPGGRRHGEPDHGADPGEAAPGAGANGHHGQAGGSAIAGDRGRRGRDHGAHRGRSRRR